MVEYIINIDVDYNEKEGKFYANVVLSRGVAAILEDTVIEIHELPQLLERLGREILEDLRPWL